MGFKITISLFVAVALVSVATLHLGAYAEILDADFIDRINSIAQLNLPGAWTLLKHKERDLQKELSRVQGAILGYAKDVNKIKYVELLKLGEENLKQDLGEVRAAITKLNFNPSDYLKVIRDLNLKQVDVLTP